VDDGEEEGVGVELEQFVDDGYEVMKGPHWLEGIRVGGTGDPAGGGEGERGGYDLERDLGVEELAGKLAIGDTDVTEGTWRCSVGMEDSGDKGGTVELVHRRHP
jgi:hypothetical protein